MSGCLSVGKLVLNNTVNNQDAYDRLRISQPHCIYSFTNVYGLATQFNKFTRYFNEKIVTTGGATSIANENSYISLKVQNNTEKIVRQSKVYIPLQLGKSSLIYINALPEIAGGRANVICRMGFFDDKNDKTIGEIRGDGFFFELDGTTMYVVERTTNTDGGTQTDIRVAQTNWNMDKLDGTGISGVNVQPYSYIRNMVIEMDGMGSGRVRMGFFYNGQIIFCHKFEHNTLTEPYIQRSSLPVRFEILANATLTGNPAELRMVSFDVQHEGGVDICVGMSRVAISSGRAVVVGENRTLMNFKLKNILNRSTIILKDLNIVTETSGDAIIWYLCLNPTLNGTIAYTGQNASSLDLILNPDDTTVELGTILTSGVIQISGSSLIELNDLKNYAITSDITGNSDVYSIVARNLTSNVVSASVILTWDELQ